MFKLSEKNHFLKDCGLKIKKSAYYIHVYTALFKALNIHHQSKMHKQDKITNKTSKQNVLQHLDPEEPLT